MPKDNIIAFTQDRVRDLAPPATGRAEYRDAKQPGLYLRVSANGTKSWRLVKKARSGKLERITLGQFPNVSVGKAKDLASVHLAEIIQGRSPIAEKRREKTLSITLATALKDYLEARDLKDSTRQDYRQLCERYLSDLLSRPLSKIDETAIRAAHKRISERGEIKANQTMRVFRAVWNFAREQYKIDGRPILGEAPTRVLSAQRLWNRETRRTRIIPRRRLRDWYQAIDGLQNRTARDYLLFLILTGLRKEEAAGLTWKNVDFAAGAFTIVCPKNHQEHTLPLTDCLSRLLQQRPRSRPHKETDYVFPGKNGRAKLSGIYKSIATASAAAGLEFRPHDLRRSFATVAETLGYGGYTLKRLLNHVVSNDVTQGYICLDPDSLRPPLEAIHAYFLQEFGISQDADTAPKP